MNQLEDMRIYVAVVDAGTLTEAADQLGLSKQYVSKRLMALESRLHVRLLIRTTRSLRTTDIGQRYYEQAQRVIDEVEQIDAEIAEQNASPRGLLRVAAPMTFGTMHLSPALPRFLGAHPDVALELTLNDRTIDLIGEGFDVGVRIGALPDSTLVAQQVATMEMVTCCSPDYRQRRGAPQRPAELARFDCLLYGHQRRVEWRFAQAGKPLAISVAGRLCANNGEVIRDAACAGLGYAHLPTFIVGDAIARGELVTVLDGWRPPAAGVHTVYPSHRQASLAVRAFADFMRSTFAAATRGAPRPAN
ncbi:LysR family transcriptional regulator [Solimonas marina]|uniref:LysR family transcriptional regulator n=1 Tax=Solimonas marina TaxID=2714601 RepID=A0A970B546_9GAMM|nr:LysR family transcriptional regulator [Solimonas marina]NKF23017.1 LysR family transcriptional regulator [Solimonas marina]